MLIYAIIGPHHVGRGALGKEGETKESYDSEMDTERPRSSKRKGSSTRECDTRPSKRTRTGGLVQQADIAGPSPSCSSTNNDKDAEIADPGRTESGRFKCLHCKETFVAKNVRDRHAELHEPDRIVYVCRGRQSE